LDSIDSIDLRHLLVLIEGKHFHFFLNWYFPCTTDLLAQNNVLALESMESTPSIRVAAPSAPALVLLVSILISAILIQIRLAPPPSGQWLAILHAQYKMAANQRVWVIQYLA
jgi:hypothetical protein